MLPDSTSIRRVNTVQDLDKVKILLREYFAWIDHALKVDMNYQHIEQELAGLPGDFAAPSGCILLAETGVQPTAASRLAAVSHLAAASWLTGMVALRPFTEGVCEMKRMYVRPEARGLGIGKLLCQEIIGVAQQIGYTRMVLDTEVSLVAAQNLYLSFGFKVVPPYYEVPPEVLPRTIFMARQL